MQDLRVLSQFLRTHNTAPTLLLSPNNYTLLHAAALTNNHLVLTFLLDTVSVSGASKEVVRNWVNTPAVDGSTAIHLACSHGNKAMVDVLVSRGGDLSVKTKDRLGAVHFAAQGNHPGMVLYLLRTFKASIYETDSGGQNALHRAALYGAEYVVELLLAIDEQKVLVNSVDAVNSSPLHYAVVSRSSRIVRTLLSYKADPMLRDDRGRSPLSIAKGQNQSYIHDIISESDFKVMFGLRAPVREMRCKFLAVFTYLLLYLIINLFNLAHQWSSLYVCLLVSEVLLFLYLNVKDPGHLPKHTYRSIDALYDAYDYKKVCLQCITPHSNRSRHCLTCGRCVERFDHHCPWINNCVGGKNIGAFFCFLIVTEVSLAASVYLNGTVMYESGVNRETMWPLLIAFTSALFAIPVGNLTYVQSANFLYGLTTNERQSTWRKSEQGEERCSAGNCYDMCCNRSRESGEVVASLQAPLINA